jgi:excisionase family DNA binding protein
MRDERSVASPWMNIREASRHARLSTKILRREIRAGRLRAGRVGGRREFRLRREWLDAYIESGRETTQPVVRQDGKD